VANRSLPRYFGQIWPTGARTARSSAPRRVVAVLAALAFLALITPGVAAASEPWPQTGYAVPLTADSATVTGDVKTGDEPTSFYFEYAPAASEFCTSRGTSGTPVATAPAPVHYDGEQVETEIKGLTSGADLCFRMVAQNATATIPGEIRTLTVGEPTVTTSKQSNRSATTSALRGWINPADQDATYHFEWGQPGSCWANSTPEKTLRAHDDGNVEALLEGLNAGAKYCYRLVATNSAATRAGPTLVFTAGLPQLGPPQAVATGPTTMTLAQTINPAGQDTTYHVEYDPNASYFCMRWDGVPPPATHATPLGTVAAGAGDTRISTLLDGLTPGTQYCSRLIVSNASGRSEDDSEDVWTAGAPALHLDRAFATGPTTAVAEATLNPAGTATSVAFKYALARSGACYRADLPGAAVVVAAPVPADTSDHDLKVAINGLRPGSTYCIESAATSDGGVVASNGTLFTTPTSSPTNPDPSGGSPVPDAPLLRSFSVPARVTSRNFAAIHASVDLGRRGSTVTVTASRLVHGVPVARVGRVSRRVGAAGRHVLTVRLTSTARRQLAKLTKVRLRTTLVVSGLDGRRAKRTATVVLQRRG
jgi:hypothetical protein